MIGTEMGGFAYSTVSPTNLRPGLQNRSSVFSTPVLIVEWTRHESACYIGHLS